MTQHILVTGGAGYIGSHTCKQLARSGFVPVAYDDLRRGHEWAVKWGPLERGDIADGARLRQVLEAYRPVAVLHFSADAYIGESVASPEKYYLNNVAGSAALLSTLLEQGPQCFVFSSSCAVYGVPAQIPIREEEIQNPINPYGFTKFVVERMLRDFATAHDLRFVTLRYFNAAGADPDGDIGEDHDPEPHLVPSVLDVALGRRGQIEIFGADYPTEDGTCVRDYVHVADLAAAHVLAVRSLLGGGQSQAVNLGTGSGFSVKQVIETSEQVTGRKINAKVGPRRPGDPPILIADHGSARAALGWVPQRGSLRTQIEDAWRWHQSHFRKHSAITAPSAEETFAPGGRA